MLVIRRLDDGKRSYTAMFLPGEPAKIFPTTNQEHARIMQIYKQDRAYPDILNDFTDYAIGHDTFEDVPKPEPAAKPASKRRPRKTKPQSTSK